MYLKRTILLNAKSGKVQGGPSICDKLWEPAQRCLKVIFFFGGNVRFALVASNILLEGKWQPSCIKRSMGITKEDPQRKRRDSLPKKKRHKKRDLWQGHGDLGRRLGTLSIERCKRKPWYNPGNSPHYPHFDYGNLFLQSQLETETVAQASVM